MLSETDLLGWACPTFFKFSLLGENAELSLDGTQVLSRLNDRRATGHAAIAKSSPKASSSRTTARTAETNSMATNHGSLPSGTRAAGSTILAQKQCTWLKTQTYSCRRHLDIFDYLYPVLPSCAKPCRQTDLRRLRRWAYRSRSSRKNLIT